MPTKTLKPAQPGPAAGAHAAAAAAAADHLTATGGSGTGATDSSRETSARSADAVSTTSAAGATGGNDATHATSASAIGAADTRGATGAADSSGAAGAASPEEGARAAYAEAAAGVGGAPQYAVFLFERVPAQELPAEVMRGHLELPDRIAERGGRVLAGVGLAGNETATSVRGGIVTDGPFVETKEVMAGMYVLEARDLDHALELAAMTPIVDGGVEVRPMLGFEVLG
jgi:hypothetical protein